MAAKPTKAKKLTALEVQAKGPGKYHDGSGLYLQVAASGARRWIFVYGLRGKQREMGLGSADQTLEPERHLKPKAAREAAAAARLLLRDGIDPIDAREQEREAAARAAAAAARAASSVTFGQVADDFLIAKIEPESENLKHLDQWRTSIGARFADPKRTGIDPAVYAKHQEALRALRAMPIADVDVEAVERVLKPIWNLMPETASRTRGRLEQVLNAATARKLRTGDNPAAWKILKYLLPDPTKTAMAAGLAGNHAAMPYKDVPEFIRILRQREAMAARMLEFTILTAARTGEVIGARWPEIDWAERLWTVPEARMKAGEEHKVPLSDRAIAILREVEAVRVGEYVFPSRGDTPHSNMAMLSLLRRMDRANFTVHGFRSSFRDWVSETTDHGHEAAEMALAHTIASSVEASYRRGKLIEKRRVMMQDWCDYCGSTDTPSNVMRLTAAQPRKQGYPANASVRRGHL